MLILLDTRKYRSAFSEGIHWDTGKDLKTYIYIYELQAKRFSSSSLCGVDFLLIIWSKPCKAKPEHQKRSHMPYTSICHVLPIPHTYVKLYKYMYKLYIYMYVCLYMNIYICIWIWMCIYIYMSMKYMSLWFDTIKHFGYDVNVCLMAIVWFHPTISGHEVDDGAPDLRGFPRKLTAGGPQNDGPWKAGNGTL